MADSGSKYYLTTPIYYVNARPHIGHAYTTIVADVLARRHRLLGDDTFFLTGTDEHGQKIERSAAAAGLAPQEFTDQVSATFREPWRRMGLTFDDFIRTTEERHRIGVQKLFNTLKDNGYIYLDTYTGAYCVSDEAFVDVPPGEACPECGNKTELLSESNFYFKLSAFQQPVLDLIESNRMLIQPETLRNEVLSFVRGGLKDLSISRTGVTWGIPVPGDPGHVIYVWLDALANYMTAVGYGDESEAGKAKFAKWWPADLHLIGKEIARFHCVYWPAFLMAAGLPLPKVIAANGWLLFQDSKMSKSKGNVVRIETILDAFGDEVYGKQFSDSTKADRDLFASDVMRYFLLREVPFGQDGNFSLDAMVTRYNADLANGYGNLVSRTLKMISDYFSGSIPEGIPFAQSMDTVKAVMALVAAIGDVAATGFAEQLTTTAMVVTTTDGFLTATTPWKLAKVPDQRERLACILYTAAESIRLITALLYPVLPFATAAVWRQLGLGEIESAAARGELKDLVWGGLRPGTRLGTLAPIFPRADKGLAAVMTEMEVDKNTPVGHANAAHDASPEPKSEFAEMSLASQTHVSGARDGAAGSGAGTAAPDAGPRTGTLVELNPGAQVGASAAVTTEREGTPSHTEAQASGIFAAEALGGISTQIGIEDFAKVELRVAQILVAERIPKADKLLRLEVDLGYETRQILSGIAEWYTPEELVGRKIVVITNLAPRKMRGLESHGMLLAASAGENGKPVLATFGEEIAVGSRLK